MIRDSLIVQPGIYEQGIKFDTIMLFNRTHHPAGKH